MGVLCISNQIGYTYKPIYTKVIIHIAFTKFIYLSQLKPD